MRYGGGIEFAMGSDLWLRFSGGVNTERRFHVWKGTQTLLDNDAEDSVYAGLALILR